MKRNLLINLALTITYFTISFLCFFVFSLDAGDSMFSMILYFPALLVFGIGFSGGGVASIIFSALISFLIILILLFSVVTMINCLFNSNKKK